MSPRFIWNCTACQGSGTVSNRSGRPVTSLVNQSALQHRHDHPNCPLAKSAEVKLVPFGCVFIPEESSTVEPLGQGKSSALPTLQGSEN